DTGTLSTGDDNAAIASALASAFGGSWSVSGDATTTNIQITANGNQGNIGQITLTSNALTWLATATSVARTITGVDKINEVQTVDIGNGTVGT
ncbi:hypothetical protein ACI3PL_20505, partial [Lacticaseibacillus paracasei]